MPEFVNVTMAAALLERYAVCSKFTRINTCITPLYYNLFAENKDSTKLWLLLDSFEFDGFHVFCANLNATFPSDGDVDVRVYGLPCLLRAIASKVCRAGVSRHISVSPFYLCLL